MTIVPRWEWRSFADSFGSAADRLAAAPLERVEESDEVYVLSTESDASVKLRAGVADVKHLLEVGRGGIELWVPVMKASFPLPAAEVHTLLSALGLPQVTLHRVSYDVEACREEVLGPHPGILAVDVHKHRDRRTFGGCMAEMTVMSTSAGSVRSIAVEDPDPDRVAAAVDALGLSDRPVVCVARGLKALVGFRARRFAAIDVGTNSVKLHVGEEEPDDTWTDVADAAEVTRLGEGADRTGRLGATPIARTVEAVSRLADAAHRDGAEEVVVVGTAGLRAAPNADDLVRQVRGRTGLEVEIIPAEEEARLAYVAATADLPPASGTRLVFDTGGGSSQFTFGRDAEVAERFSLPVGAARFTERFRLDEAVGKEVVAEALAAIAAELPAVEGRPAPDAMVGMGGAVTNLAAVQHELGDYDPAVIRGAVLDLGEIDRQIELYRTRDAAQRRDIVGLQHGRAAVILAGACIVRTILTLLGHRSFVVSDRGLRHALVAERFGGGPLASAPVPPLSASDAAGPRPVTTA